MNWRNYKVFELYRGFFPTEFNILSFVKCLLQLSRESKMAYEGLSYLNDFIRNIHNFVPQSLTPHILIFYFKFVIWIYSNLILIQGIAVYQSEEDKDSDVEQSSTDATAALSQKRTDVEELALDPNHNYFIFAETMKTEKLKGKEAETRARFERCISLWSTSAPESEMPTAPRLSQTVLRPPSTHVLGPDLHEHPEESATTLPQETAATQSWSKRKSTIIRQSSQKVVHSLSRSSSKFKGGTGSGSERKTGEDVRIPMCGLVIGGDRFTLRQVYCSIMQNQCPMVIAKVIYIRYEMRSH